MPCHPSNPIGNVGAGGFLEQELVDFLILIEGFTSSKNEQVRASLLAPLSLPPSTPRVTEVCSILSL